MIIEVTNNQNFGVRVIDLSDMTTIIYQIYNFKLSQSKGKIILRSSTFATITINKLGLSKYLLNSNQEMSIKHEEFILKTAKFSFSFHRGENSDKAVIIYKTITPSVYATNSTKLYK